MSLRKRICFHAKERRGHFLATTQPWFYLLLCSALLSACSPRPAAPVLETPPSPTSISEATPTTRLVATSAPTQTPEASLPPFPSPLTTYTLTAHLDYDSAFLSVEEQIIYLNRLDMPLSDLLLVVEPNRYQGGFQLKAITWQDGSPVTKFALNGPQLSVQLDQPLQPNQSISLSLTYDSTLPHQDAPFGRAARAINLADWFPYLPPYRSGEGWLVHKDAPFGEHLVYDIADFDVSIDLASPNSAAGVPLTIAAPAAAEGSGASYHYHLQAARTFAWAVSDQYEVLTTQVGETKVLAYAFPYHEGADQPALDATAQTLEVFNRLFAPYPRPTLSVVEADFLDGMEYDGLFFLSHAFYDYFTGNAQNNLVIIAAHETAHQWWFSLVGNDQALEPWLDEALSTYSEALFYEQVYPDLADWLWENRVTFHKPEGWVDETIYDATGFYPYRNAVYLRGALFLRDLRSRLGDEAFFAFLRAYLNQFAYRQATGADFFALLASYAPGGVQDIVTQYFSHP